MNKICLVFYFFVAGLVSSLNAHGQQTSSANRFCNLAYCFNDQAAKEKYEKDNKCLFADSGKCGSSVKAVQGALNKVSKNDPTYGFYRNQECVANMSCFNKGILDNSKWLDDVVQDFITPLVKLQGAWPDRIKECGDLIISPGMFCQKLMAEYHISQDLQASLNKNGCGTKKDWDQVGEWLKKCVDKGLKEDLISGVSQVVGGFAEGTVIAARNKVYESCKKYRTDHGLKVESNT